MNRAERKRREREEQKNNKIYTLTKKQLAEYENKIRNDEAIKTKQVFIAVMANSLNANYRFGKKRIERVQNDINGQLISVREGIVHPQEVLDMSMKIGVDFSK